MKNKIYVLVTHDKLYYVTYGKPEVIKEKAIKIAEKIQKENSKIDDVKKLIKKVKDNPKENPCNAWFIHSLENIITEQSRSNQE